jgi:hypothetical protein
MQPAWVPLTTILWTEASLVYCALQRRWGGGSWSSPAKTCPSKGLTVSCQICQFPASQPYFFQVIWHAIVVTQWSCASIKHPRFLSLSLVGPWAFGRGVSWMMDAAAYATCWSVGGLKQRLGKALWMEASGFMLIPSYGYSIWCCSHLHIFATNDPATNQLVSSITNSVGGPYRDVKATAIGLNSCHSWLCFPRPLVRPTLDDAASHLVILVRVCTQWIVPTEHLVLKPLINIFRDYFHPQNRSNMIKMKLFFGRFVRNTQVLGIP